MAQTTLGSQGSTGSGGGDFSRLSNSRSGRKAATTDWIFRNATLLFALSAVVLIVGIALTLSIAARPSIAHEGWRFFGLDQWDPVAPDADRPKGNIYGALPFVYGTIVTSALALLIAVPLSVGSAIFLSEIAPRKVSVPISFVIEMLAAVPSIVYGFWAVNILVPLLKDHVDNWLGANFGRLPFFMPSPEVSSQNFLAAGLILALMVLPFITAVSRDILMTVPNAQREAAYGMGATRWEVIRSVVLRYASSGIIGAVMLGLGRAIGETMAVTLVIGSTVTVPHLNNAATFSLFRPGYTMTSVVADQYPSPNSLLHTSALTEVALTLFFVTVIINGLARGLVWLTALRSGGATSDASLKAKALVGTGLRLLAVAMISVAFLYQAYRDIREKGAVGLFGGAELIGLAIIVLTIFNRRAAGTRIYRPWRGITNGVALTTSVLCALTACGALALLLAYVFKSGISSINPQFFRPPNPTDPDTGGLLHAIMGSGELILMASIIGVPLGIMGGIFLAEFGNNRLGFWIRYAADLLNGVPSIVIGIFAFGLIVVTTHSNLGYAGGFALGVMMIPVVMRTTEELIRIVPNALREGSLGLGATHAYTIWRIVLPTARNGIVTGVLLAVARVAGETAPLLIIGCNSSVFNKNPHDALANLPMAIYTTSQQPSPVALQQSWGIALILVAMVFIMSLLARIATRGRMTTR